MTATDQCELCVAERITPWFFEDDTCWIALCEQCDVPMVVWKRHDPNPPEQIRVVLHKRLREVVDQHFGFDPWFDTNMRTVPTHYHVHARPRVGLSRK